MPDESSDATKGHTGKPIRGTGVTDRQMDEDYFWEQKQLPVHTKAHPNKGYSSENLGQQEPTGTACSRSVLGGAFPGTSAALSLNETAQLVCTSFHNPYSLSLGGGGLVNLTVFWGLVEPLSCPLSGENGMFSFLEQPLASAPREHPVSEGGSFCSHHPSVVPPPFPHPVSKYPGFLF